MAVVGGWLATGLATDGDAGSAGIRGQWPVAGRGPLAAGRGSPMAGRVAGGGVGGDIFFLEVFRIFF
jgi:hypothetical protein